MLGKEKLENSEKFDLQRIMNTEVTQFTRSRRVTRIILTAEYLSSFSLNFLKFYFQWPVDKDNLKTIFWQEQGGGAI